MVKHLLRLTLKQVFHKINTRSFILSYLHDSSVNLKSTVKLFADDTPIFYVVKDPNTSVKCLNHDLIRISEWACRWKMSFNPDHSKQGSAAF